MRAASARAARVLGALVLAACHGAGSPKLEGRWQGVRAEGVDPGAQERDDAFASSLRMEFRGDAVTVTTPSEMRSGKFAVVAEDAKALVIAIGEGADAQRESFAIVDAKTIAWAVGDSKRIVLVRQ